jgi:hypothetical protein
MVAEYLHRIERMKNAYDGQSVPIDQLPEQTHDVSLMERIEVIDRFIQRDDVRILTERPRQQNPLRFSA